MELLVVIAILGLLAALLLPAVQAARESARRAGCQSNLHQIGIAVHSYLDSYRVLPTDGSGLHSFHAKVLAYLDQPAMAADFMSDPDAAALRHQWVGLPIYNCPSQPGELAVRTTYGLNWGTGFVEHKQDGFFVPFRALRLQDVRDGVSQTAFISEIRASNASDPRSLFWHTPQPLTNPGDEDAFAELCASMSLEGLEFHTARGSPWPWPSDSQYDHILSPNRRNCLNGPQQGPSHSLEFRTCNSGSHHPGGAQLLFVDGSARFVNDSIDRRVWRALGSRAGGEAVSSQF